MKRRRIFAGLVAVIFVGVVVAFVSTREREPVYQGKKLSEWIEVLRVADSETSEAREAADALRSIGTNGLPFVLRWMCYEPGNTREWVERQLRRCLPARIGDSESFRDFALGKTGRLQDGTRAYFEALGGAASPAIPQLVELMTGTNSADSEIPARAMSALADIGEKSVPALVAVLKDRKRANWMEALSALGNFAERLRGGASPAGVTIIGCMEENDLHLTVYATWVLGELHVEPNVSIPALMRGLEHADRKMRETSARALGRFGGDARSAVPTLITIAKTDPEPSVREIAVAALTEIAPGVLRMDRIGHF